MSALAHQAQTGAGGTGDTVHIQGTLSTSPLPSENPFTVLL